MSGLSDEQRRRLEENRKKALAIRAAKQQRAPQPQQQQQPHKSQQQVQHTPQQQHKPQQQLQNRPPQPQHTPQQYHHQQQQQQQRLPPPQQQRPPQQQQQQQQQRPPQQQQRPPQQQQQQRPPPQQQQHRLPQQQQQQHNSFSLQPLAPRSQHSSMIGPPTVTRTTSHIKPIPPANPNPTHTPFQPTHSHPPTTNPTGPTQPSFYKTKTPTAAFSTYGSKANQRDGSRRGAGQERGRRFDKVAGQSGTSAPATTRPGHTITKGTCVLVSRTRFEVQVDFMIALIDLFKTMETKQYNPQTKCWSFDLQEYNKLKKAIAAALPGMVQLEELSHPVQHTFKKRIRDKTEEADARRVPTADLCHVDECLVDALLPFQRQGVNFAVWKQGRLLLADDMGLGKTLQAICVACYYREQWPLLIVVPSSVRFAWRAQLLRWVPSLDPQDINVITTAKDHMTGGEVTIVSYDLLVRSMVLQARHFDVVIMDECHLLKNSKTARTKAAMPIIKHAARVLLLSGTPALSRPSELYTQISAIEHRAFPNYHNYGVRYCEGKQHQWGWDYTGSSHMEELQIVLQENIMIRRLKKDVLSQLPPKRREMIILNPSNVKGTKFMKAKHQQVDNLKGMERRGALLEYFHETGSCKGPAVKEYVLDLLEADHKFLFFGHHQEMLDCVEEAVRKHKYGFIRIDGKTSGDQRNQLVEDFQRRDDIKVALLSIMAANAGINLTAASLVVFGELFWNPGILVQAEDRVHRIGQEDSVSIRYLVATGTADDYIWPLVQQKLNVLGKAGLSKDDFSNADTTHMKDPKQPDMMSFFEQSFFESVDWEEDTDSWAPRDNTLPQAREEFVENPSPKKKTPRKRAAPSTPSKLKQRTIFKFLSPSKQGPAGDTPAAKLSPPKTAKSSLFTYFTPVKEGGVGRQEHGVSEKGESGGGAESVETTAGEFEDWDDEIMESLLQDVNFDEPAAKRGRLEQCE